MYQYSVRVDPGTEPTLRLCIGQRPAGGPAGQGRHVAVQGRQLVVPQPQVARPALVLQQCAPPVCPVPGNNPAASRPVQLVCS